MNKQEIIEVLEKLGSEWFASSQQNAIHSKIMEDKGLHKLASRLAEEAKEEFEEAQKIIGRILELGGTPKIVSKDLPIFYDIQELLMDIYKVTEAGLKELSLLEAKITDDFITKNMIQQFILDEKEHYDWAREDVKLIELVGLENYILEQR